MSKIYTIKPYKVQGYFGLSRSWTFKTPTDEYPELPERTESQNELVAGFDVFLDRIESAFGGNFAIQFATEEFISQFEMLQSYVLDRIDGDEFNVFGRGNIYISRCETLYGWLCSGLHDYFPQAPKTLYLTIVRI